jgi:ATP-dependent Lhr-like helicase
MAFVVPEEYRVIHQGRHVGNVTSAPDVSVDQYIILAGRRWRILEVDQERLEILVEPSPGGRLPRFEGRALGDIHPRVREEMKALLFRDISPAYLNPKACQMLADARAAAKEADLASRTFLQDGPDTIWFTWTGSRIQRTLAGLGLYLGGLKVQDEGVALRFEQTAESEVRRLFRGFLENPPGVSVLASKFSERANEKYEPFLSEDLQSQVFASHCLDLEGALKTLASIG